MRMPRGEQIGPPSPAGRPRPVRDSTIEATLLPAGLARQGMEPAAGTADTWRSPRRPRWTLWLGGALALAAVVTTVAAVSGLREAPASTKTAATPPVRPVTPSSQVVVTRSGPSRLHLTERLVLGRPASSIQLTRPDLSADRTLTLPQPAISGLRVMGAGGELSTQPTATGWVAQSSARRTSSAITVEYDADGAIIRQSQSVSAGRALLVVAPLTAPIARGLGVPISVTAPGIAVRQAICVTSPATQQLCGSTNAAGRVAQLTSWQQVAVIVLQADLTP